MKHRFCAAALAAVLLLSAAPLSPAASAAFPTRRAPGPQRLSLIHISEPTRH